MFLLLSILLWVIPSGLVYGDDINEEEPGVEIFSAVSPAVKHLLPRVDAGAAIVMDMGSGRVLFEKNAYTRRAMASTTKIMTAVVALENGNLDDTVTVSKRAANIWGSTIHLREGQKISMQELMYGLMLNSGNDAAIAIAEHIAGNVEAFCEMMTLKAQEIGAKDTSFKSPHGLDAKDHYTTAYDLALITRYALKNPVFSKIVATTSTRISTGGLYNTNEMLGAYPGADGVKTGYTGQAGRCLVTSATRDNWRLISVVLGCSTRTVRARSSSSLLDYAFTNFKPVKLLQVGEEVGVLPVHKGIVPEVPVVAAEGITIPLKDEEKDALDVELELPEVMEAPVRSGEVIGNVVYRIEGKEIGRSLLKAGEDVRRKNFRDYFEDILRIWGQVMSPNKK